MLISFLLLQQDKLESALQNYTSTQNRKGERKNKHTVECTPQY